jgi:hypothetical protein
MRYHYRYWGIGICAAINWSWASARVARTSLPVYFYPRLGQ